MGGGLGSRNTHMQKMGRAQGQHHRTEKLGNLIESQTFGTTESQRDTENSEPSPPTQCVTQMTGQGQGQAEPQLATHCLFLPVELGGVLPCVFCCHSHSCLTPAFLCLGLWGQLQAGEGWELLRSSRSCPNLPSHASLEQDTFQLTCPRQQPQSAPEL